MKRKPVFSWKTGFLFMDKAYGFWKIIDAPN